MTKRILIIASCLSGMITASQAMAQSVAPRGQQCSYDSVPAFDCINPDDGVDIRLLVMEYQTCKDGNVTAVDRDTSALYVKVPGVADQIDDLRDANVQLTLSGQRVQLDDWGSQVSIDLPRAAVVKDGDTTFQLEIPGNIEKEEAGVSITGFHYPGSFRQLDKSGQVVATGRLQCLIISN